MDWLNYHHLYYFWVVAREGSLTKACAQLRLAKPTVSGQIRRLEEVLNEKLFDKKGRNLVLTEIGRMTFNYADQIFSTGQELMDAIAGKKLDLPIRLAVGIAGVVPKQIVHRLLEPAFHLEKAISLVCHEDRSVEEFTRQLAIHNLDVVLSDAPAGPTSPVKIFSHLLGECGTTFFGTPNLAKTLSGKFPRNINNQKMLLPSTKSTLRKSLDGWFHDKKIRPSVVGEFDDPALMNAFGQEGMGVFPVPTVIEKKIRLQYRVQIIGRANNLTQKFFALSAERKLTNPAVLSICETARQKLFG